MTIMRWAKQYGDIMEKYMNTIRPAVGEVWHTDEVYMKIKGKRRYLFAILDSKTRFWIAKQIGAHKGTGDVKPMFRDAHDITGMIPARLISDGAPNFGAAHKALWAPRNIHWKDSQHIRCVHMRGDMNNNKQEAFNGNTIRHREKVCRGLKKDDSVIISGLRIYHNHVRPHLGLPGNMTPGEAAGIHIDGNNKILTMIQAATLADIRFSQ